MYSKLNKPRSSWFLGVVLSLALALVLVACGDVDTASTAVSSTIRIPATPTTQPPASNTTAPASGGGATTAAGGGAAGGDAANGLKLFNSNNCGLCHPNGGKTAGTGLKLQGTTRDDAYIRAQLKNGKGAMPAYPKLTEQEQTDIIAYIRSL